MPKPFMGVSANGCHHNISLWQGDENAFMPDTDDQQKPSQIGLYAIGGILEHLGALTAVTASTVNSYRRLWDTGFWAPVFADWGFQNRTTALRVSAPGRFEYRSVDSAVNPYLSMAALIAAMRDGIERKLDPGEPEERNIYEAMEAGKEVNRIPMTFGDALDALEADEVVKQRAARRDVHRLHALQAGRVGEVLCDRHGLGRDGVPGRSAVAKGNAHVRNRGDHLPGRLGARHRRRDDADAPVDEAPRPGLDGLRAVRERRERQPRNALQARRREHAAGLRLRGPPPPAPHGGRVASRVARRANPEVEEETPYAFRVSFEYDGDLKLLADFVEDIPEAEVLSLGRALEIVKDLGDAESVHEQYGLADFQGTHAIGHVRMATESEVDIAGAHPYWAYPYSDVAVVHNGQLTNYFMWRRRLERAGRRFMSECDSEIIAVYLAEEMSKGASLEESMHKSLDELDGVFTYIAVTKDELGVAKDELAAKPLVLYESDDLVALAPEEIAIRPARRPRDRHVRPLRARGSRMAAVGERQISYDARGSPSRSRTHRAPRSSRTASRPSTRAS